MKKGIALLVALCFLTGAALAEPMLIDMRLMTSAELESFQNQVREEISYATDLPYAQSSKIEDSFKEDFEKQFVPDGATASYPFFGLSTSKERNLVTVSGNCTVRFADKSKKDYPMEAIYLVSDDGAFKQIALYAGDNIYSKDEAVLAEYGWMLTESQRITLGITPIPRPEVVMSDEQAEAEATTPVLTQVSESTWAEMSDEELDAALTAIKAEQRARIQTKIALDSTSISLGKGKTQKLTAELVDLPDDLKAGKLTWETSDKKVATVTNGMVKAVDAGTAVITCRTTLSDGTEIDAECAVEVIVPIASISAKEKKIALGVGESAELELLIKPENATNQSLIYESSDESVISVDGSGVITGRGAGKAIITIETVDGSDKKASIDVSVTMKDDIGVTKEDGDGHVVTLLGYTTGRGSSFAKPESGNIFIFPEFEMINNSDEEQEISSIYDFDAYADGYKCDYSFDASLETKNELSGTIMPGRKMKGRIGFEIPSDWQELEIHVTPGSIWFGDTLVFIIYNQK